MNEIVHQQYVKIIFFRLFCVFNHFFFSRINLYPPITFNITKKKKKYYALLIRDFK